MSGWEEQLDPTPWWRANDGRRGIGIVSCLVLLGVVAVFVIASQGSSPQSTGPTPGPVMQTELVEPPLNLDFELLRRCPPGEQCRLTTSVPRGTSAAIAQYLPGGYERQAETLTGTTDHRLRFRAVNVVLGAVELLVIVSVPDSIEPDAVSAADPHPGAAIRYVRRHSGPFQIQVQFTGPPGGTPPVDRARELAGDPRLLAMV